MPVQTKRNPTIEKPSFAPADVGYPSGILPWQDLRKAMDAAPVRGRYNLCRYHQGKAFREHSGAPDPVMRAKAFAAVLAQIPLSQYSGEAFFGSLRGLSTDTLPEGISEADYTASMEAVEHHGVLNFFLGFDHTTPDYPGLLAKGVNGILETILAARAVHDAPEERAFLDGVEIALRAFVSFIRRCAAVARASGRSDLAQILEAIAGPPPQTLWQAMQLVWITHLAFSCEGRGHMALGRLDQYLFPFYQRDLAAGRLDRAQALGLVCHLWTRLHEIGQIQNICIGGVTPDGDDATNELSYLFLEATALCQTTAANLNARLHDGSPERFHRACYRCIRTGIGFPAIENDHIRIPSFLKLGLPLGTARDYSLAGCHEPVFAGRQQAWGDSRVNTPLALVRALQKLRGEKEQSFARLCEIFRDCLHELYSSHIAAHNERLRKEHARPLSDPFFSALTKDCIARARDVNAGGARIKRFIGLSIMGLATMADSLAAVKRLVFDEGCISYDELMEALDKDFADGEEIRQLLLNRAPKYGNHEPEVDRIASDIVKWASTEVLRHEVEGGGRYVASVAANIQNISCGREVDATPDGRHSGTPLSDAGSPFFGRDRHGPTAFLGSVSTPDYTTIHTGAVINMKFDPDLFRGAEGERNFLEITRAFVRLRVPQLQFNFNGNRLLEEARKDPEKHRNLIVRVSGFSAYFTGLAPEVQDDVIRRNAHGACQDCCP